MTIGNKLSLVNGTSNVSENAGGAELPSPSGMERGVGEVNRVS